MPGKNISIVTLALVLSTVFSGCRNSNKESAPIEVENRVDTPVIRKEANLYFGIDTTNYRVIKGRIRRNQFLSEILDDYGISYSDIDKLVRNSGDTFDVRNMKSGAGYTILVNKQNEAKASYMIYDQDLLNQYILDFTDSALVTRVDHDIRTELRYSSGVIETSLWDAMISEEINPVLAVDLSEIYAWSIDFFGLQKGDRFRIIFEEEYVDDTPVGIKKIYGAWFRHAGTDFYAIPFIQNGTETYYDTEGNSLRKAFLKAPLRYSRISSRYSNSRLHPILRIRRPHHGVDYAAPVGTPVHSIGDGRVIMAAYQSGSGRIVKVKHNSVYTTAYMHLSRYGRGISVGKYVKQGDIVGYVGTSGLSTGPHLDFRFYKNGSPVDPLKVKAPPVEPVLSENRGKFEKISYVLRQLLDGID